MGRHEYPSHKDDVGQKTQFAVAPARTPALQFLGFTFADLGCVVGPTVILPAAKNQTFSVAGSSTAKNAILDRATDNRSALVTVRLLAALGLALGLALAATAPAWAERVELAEPAKAARVFQVGGRLHVAGQLQTPASAGKAVALKLDVEAVWSYHERRLAGSGRDAESFRNVRIYDTANAKIQVAEQSSNPRLRDSVKLIVAEGQREGVRFFSPSAPLTFNELELLDTEADSLAALALLPEEPVEVMDEWKPPAWVAQFLTGVEAVEKSDLKCRFESIQDGLARVTFQGEITGGILGSATETRVNGHYLFDISRQYLSHLELTQIEKRSVGAVSPGAELTAKVVLERLPADTDKLSDAALAEIPLEPNAASLLLMFEPPELNVRCYFERKWHLFQQTTKVSVLRMLDQGSLIAQCNISPVAAAAPGKHIDETQFQVDVQRALGADFGKITQAEVIPTKDKLFVFRVTATGEVSAVPMQWMYYLIAAPSGQQVTLVFTIEEKLLPRFVPQDLSIALALAFLPPPKPPLPRNK